MNRQQEDHRRYFIDNPVNFSPERNKAVIDSTIRKYDKMVEDKRKAYKEQLAERSDAVYHYIRYLDKGGSQDIDKYLGSELARLRGEDIKKQLLFNLTGKIKGNKYLPLT